MPAEFYLLPLFSLMICLRAQPIGLRLGVIDHPGGSHKTHDRPTPLVGGIAVALPLLTYCAVYLWGQSHSLLHLALLVAIGGSFLMGFYDDRRSLPTLFRLLCGAALALTSIAILPVFIVHEFDFTFLSKPIPLTPFGIAFSVLVIVGMVNALNMADGVNGLAGGLCLIWTLFLLYYSPPEIFLLLLVLALCLSVTLVFNLRGKLFWGDSGTYSTGFAIFLLTIYTYNKSEIRLPADTIVSWFIVPVLDCLRLMLARPLMRRSPMSPDNNHLHHFLQRRMPRQWAVTSIWLMVAVPGLVSMAMPSWTLAAVFTVTGVYIWLLWWASRGPVIHSHPSTSLSEPYTNSPKCRPSRLLYICDWLPPDYGAVGQYAQLFARQMASDGKDVVLGGLTSQRTSQVHEQLPNGSFKIVKLHIDSYEKKHFARRLFWTFKANTRLVLGLWREMLWADEILFTSSPPLFLHWIAPLNLAFRKRLIYRIMDFYPECLMATRAQPTIWLRLLLFFTNFWRRRIHIFEVLSEDQRMRLEDYGISSKRIQLRRNPSPVKIPPGTLPLTRPEAYADKLLMLYSGNWGVAHDYETFVEGYRRHHEEGSGRFVLWLNATGAVAEKVEGALRHYDLPLIRSSPVPINELASLLVTPDAHLITLSDAFVGLVVPSKVHGCIASNRPVLYIGSEHSDVHQQCIAELKNIYLRVNVRDIAKCAAAFEELAERITSNQSSCQKAPDQVPARANFIQQGAGLS